MSNYLTVVGDDGWTEIVGEQTRGGGDGFSAVAGDSYDVLGQMMNQSPTLAAAVAKRAAASRPVLNRQTLTKARDWELSFGPVSGAAGTNTVVSVAPQCLFRGEKLMATDSGSPAGSQSRITQVMIGNRLQRPATGGGTRSDFFGVNSLGNGIRWDQRAAA